MTRALALAASIMWAIDEPWLRQILSIANREGPGVEAVERQLGRPLESDASDTVVMHGDVAVVAVVGPIMRYANVFTRVSGMSSVELLARGFTEAVTNPNVRAIVLNVDSPGGEVAGINEFAQMIFDARGAKPIVAYVGGTCASAAYWLASAAEQIVCDRTAQLGSIGVVAGVPNPDAKTAEEIEIVSSQSPDKRPDVKTKEGRATIQERVDALADVFLDVVARNRGVTTKVVAKDFGRGGMRVGEDAVKAGMADAIGSLESVLATLSTVPTDDDGDEDEKSGSSAPAAPAIAAFASSKRFHPTPLKEPRMSLNEKVRSILGLAADSPDSLVIAAVESAATARAELLTVTGETITAKALGVVDGWKVAAVEILPKVNAELGELRTQETARAVDEIIATGKAQKKLTPQLETQVREIAKLSVERARSMVDALSPIGSFARVATAEPEAELLVGIKHDGRLYEDIPKSEIAAIANDNPELIARMRADWINRGRPPASE